MAWMDSWRRQPDHFEWLSGYLKSRGLADPVRRCLAVVAASGVLVPANALWGPESTNRTLSIGLALITGVVSVGFVALWLTRWPTKNESIGFAFAASAGIAVGCLWQAEPVIGLTAATALAVSGGYIAFFHSARFMLLNFAAAMAIGAWGAIRVAEAGEPVLAVTGFFLVFELNVGVPFAIHIVVHSLGADLLRSDRDPLTGLLNRRAFTQAVVGRLEAGSDRCFLAVALIDLDRFKMLNDSRGHAEGDAALVEVATALTEASSETALVCRMGGEEFLVADIVSAPDPHELAQRLCDAIAAGQRSVTASVGTSTVALPHASADSKETFRRLVDLADSAMYSAKRRGGNQTQHAE
ncbi:GGDEF domain-containing protein [Mycolicibacterium sp. S2-37]|uniref:GGDEF domain-containing protein n=1 Tax=Mycolicibacterium sp. S2-37 TaxID=2810297 RepID=UPI001A945CF0|nr:GGDEF domain-containing protein [Mycolicibacterium sp. S2-37]MBO0676143.1 GGDEF domain-containing protein [Mycolicibacterium sp. S2-37]